MHTKIKFWKNISQRKQTEMPGHLEGDLDDKYYDMILILMLAAFHHLIL